MQTEPNVFIAMLDSMDVWKWLILGIALLVLELFTGTLFLLWPAIAAIIVGLIKAVVPLGWEMQLLLFAIITTAGLIWGEKVLRPRLNKGEPTDLNDRALAMIGTRVRAIADFDTGRGRVKVGDTEWAANMETGDAKAGDELRIIAVSGAKVQVEIV
jgi:membrane protein implicated in regulation of membrane protease activity